MNRKEFSEGEVGFISMIYIKPKTPIYGVFKLFLLAGVTVLCLFLLLARQQKASALIPGATWGVEPGSTVNIQDIGSGRTRINFSGFVDKSNPDTVLPTDIGVAIKRFYYIVTPDGSGNPRDPYNVNNRVVDSFRNPAIGLVSASEPDQLDGSSRRLYEMGNQTTFYCVHADGGSTGGCGPDQSVRNDWFIMDSSSPYLAPGHRICAQILLTEHHNGGAPDYGGWALFDTSDPVGASYNNSFWTLSAANCYTIPSGPSVYSLNVNSSGASGVPISASSASYAGNTNYTLTGIPNGSTFTLTAPATASGNIFNNWSGCTSTNAVARTCTMTVTGNGTVTVTYAPPPLQRLSCTVNPISLTVNEPAVVSVTLSNPNTTTSVAITASNWNVPSSTPSTGRGATYNSGLSLDGSGGGVSVPVATGSGPGQITIYSANVVTVGSAGNHSVEWDVDAGNASLSPQNCENGSAINALANPYVRFYGNDVIAGGGYGSTCNPTADARIQVKGGYRTGTVNYRTADYIGSASELATFAAGQITGLISGSQIDRPTPELVFANENSLFNTSPNPNLGGSFNVFACTPAISPQDSYTQNNGLTINNLTLVNTGQRITHIVEGDVFISANIEYNGAGWTTLNDIPLFRIYATGNIYISGGVTRLDGFYSAQGDIYTCANGAGRYALNAMVANCSARLTFNGAVAANELYLDRVVGSIGNSQGLAESAATSNAAEIFNFSPEMYLAIYADGQANNSSLNFDSILALPPAL